MSGAVAIRAMTPGDLSVVGEIEVASYSMPWNAATFDSLLRRRDADLIVAEVDGRVVGYAAAWTVLDQCELGNVAVAAGWRRRGIGALLVARMLELARARGVREVFLEVRPSNREAQRLYDRLGFRTVGRRRRYYVDPDEDALVMRLGLAPGPGGTARPADRGTDARLS
jgi:ribosomal-protein-alanine N-acetyltransferase